MCDMTHPPGAPRIPLNAAPYPECTVKVQDFVTIPPGPWVSDPAT